MASAPEERVPAGRGRAEPHPGPRWLPAVVVVFLFFAPQLAALALERNRYFLFWSGVDTLALAVAVALLSLAAIAAGALVNRAGSPLLRELRDQAMVALFGLGVVVNLLPLLHVPILFNFLRHHRSIGTLTLRGLLAASLVTWALLLFYRRAFLPHLTRTACVILSPLIPIVLVPAFAWNSWYVSPDPIPATAPARSGTPVFVFVFDEWSFVRSVEGGDFLADLPHLRELRGKSFFFTNARSPSRTTYLSMPELLFQTHDFPSLPHVFLSRSDFPDRVKADAPEDSITPAAAAGAAPPSLFTLARHQDYATYMLGYYLPYRRILGDDVGLVRSFSDYPRGSNFADKLVEATIQNPHYWRLPLLSRLWKVAYSRIFSRHWVHLNARLFEDFESVAGASPERSFVFVHFPSPHAPFVLDPEGRYRGPFPIFSNMSEDIDTDIMGGDPEDYHVSLRHLDTVVGRIIDRLRSVGRFDNALIIMTSDHSWRNDPNFPRSLPAELVRHVPLIIKTPGQTRPETIDAPLDGSHLGPLIDLALHGGLDESAAGRMIATLTDSGLPGASVAAAGAPAAGTPAAAKSAAEKGDAGSSRAPGAD
jgi:hypothetical protein